VAHEGVVGLASRGQLVPGLPELRKLVKVVDYLYGQAHKISTIHYYAFGP
jgi:hypothetical protein